MAAAIRAFDGVRHDLKTLFPEQQPVLGLI
jgi:hypothetical protein